MSNVSAKFSINTESGYGDQEKDANTLLTELDRGLRTGKVGEQSEAIVRFPRLFEKYPFPILINSAFLKLADVFRVGSNFLRLCILRVVEQSLKHLEKILNVDELVRRVFQVSHSNDPVARAITLRLLGNLACVIAERKNVHHSIINGLDSHDAVELEAAIFAAEKFAEKSKSFALSICNKLAELMEGLATPVEMKLRLIPILQHMHHDANTAEKAQQVCCGVLEQYPARGMVLITLESMSKLAAKCLMGIPDQLELLLRYLKEDPRKSVKMAALQHLKLLAKKGPHMWTTEHIETLCTFLLSTPFISLKLMCLQVLSALTLTITVSKFSTAEDSNINKIIIECGYHGNPRIAAETCTMASNIAVHKLKGGESAESPLTEATVLALEGLIITATQDSCTPQDLKALKSGLHCVVKLCHASPPLTDRFADILTTILTKQEGDTAVVLCECLSAVSSFQNELLQNLVPDITSTVKQLQGKQSQHRDKLLVAHLTLLFQALVGEILPEETVAMVMDVTGTLGGWAQYRVGRQAARYGHHSLSSKIFGKLTSQVSTEHYYFWLSALRDCSQAESHLEGSTTNISEHFRWTSEAQTLLCKAITGLRAASTPQTPLQFQSQYLHLRCKMLQVFSQLLKACNSFQTSPPPAIATTLAMTTGEGLHRSGHVVTQLQKCQRQLDDLGRQYGDLYQSSFDADPMSLTNIQILQQSCQMLIHILDAILSGQTSVQSDVHRNLSHLSGVAIEHQGFYRTWQDSLSLLGQCHYEPGAAPLTYQHMSCLKQAAMLLTQIPLSIPRFFFQSLQATNIKLAISPQPKSNEPISVSYDTHLTLRVEGVIQHSRPGLFRQVDKVSISVRSEQQSRGPMVAEVKAVENPTNDMSQTADPHNDYFSVQFLLAFPVTGLHLVVIDVAVVDTDGVSWNTGPRTTLTVKSYDEAVQRQQQQQYAAQRQQMRATGQINAFNT